MEFRALFPIVDAFVVVSSKTSAALEKYGVYSRRLCPSPTSPILVSFDHKQIIQLYLLVLKLHFISFTTWTQARIFDALSQQELWNHNYCFLCCVRVLRLA